jgi:Cu/Ag efflux protein CusF
MRKAIAFLVAALLSASPVFAQDHSAHAMHGMSGMSGMSEPANTAPLSEGTVKKVDKAKGRITLAHGPLLNLDMPGMTMSFAVAKPAVIGKLKEGDKVRFLAEDRNGDLTITRLEAAK